MLFCLGGEGRAARCRAAQNPLIGERRQLPPAPRPEELTLPLLQCIQMPRRLLRERFSLNRIDLCPLYGVLQHALSAVIYILPNKCSDALLRLVLFKNDFSMTYNMPASAFVQHASGNRFVSEIALLSK